MLIPIFCCMFVSICVCVCLTNGFKETKFSIQIHAVQCNLDEYWPQFLQADSNHDTQHWAYFFAVVVIVTGAVMNKY